MASYEREDRILRWFDDPTEAQARAQREFLRESRGGRYGTVLVQFRYRIANGQYRVARVLMDVPNQREQREMMRESGQENNDPSVWLENWIRDKLVEFLTEHPDVLANMSGPVEERANTVPDMEQENPLILDSTSWVLNIADILERVSLSLSDVAHLQRDVRARRMFNHQRSFVYMFPGFNVNHLGHMLPRQFDEHLLDCDRMCAYRMLRDKNPGSRDGCDVFRPERVNEWLNSSGHPVGGLECGLSPSDIQAHAEHYRYGHCAMDLSRSVISFHLPDHRNHHYKTICYYVVGDHCQSVDDPTVVQNIMRSTRGQLGKRRYGEMNPIFQDLKRSKSKKSRKCWITIDPGRSERGECEEQLIVYGQEESVDGREQAKDVVVEDMDTEDSKAKEKGGRIYPVIEEIGEYVHRYVQEEWTLHADKLDPEYVEGDDPRRVHFYVCTDADNVEFLYQYLVRVRKVDPMNFARSYGGQCTQLRMKNVYWLGCRYLDMVLFLHRRLFPEQPWKGQCSLGGYGLIMVQRSLGHVCLLDCMSLYPTDIQRVCDDRGYGHSKHILETYQPAYSDPRKEKDGRAQCLIPTCERERIDLIRSYTSMVGLVARDQDEYPIHDLSSVLRPFDCSHESHRRLPVGTYVVRCPLHPKNPDMLRLVPYLKGPWKQVYMTHRLLRWCIQREILEYEDIVWICASPNERQRQYGGVLARGLWQMVQDVYDLEKDTECPPDFDAKVIVNRMIGMCQAVKVPSMGQRYVFSDLESLWVLLTGMLGRDQVRSSKILHHTGMFHHTAFDYYEMDSTGISTRKFHLQPVYQMVVESQSMVIVDMLRHIPIRELVQVHIDAIEWKKCILGNEFTDRIVPKEVYEQAKTDKKVLELCRGLFHPEIVKSEEHARCYHTHHAKVGGATDPGEHQGQWGARFWLHHEDWERHGVDTNPHPLLQGWKERVHAVTEDAEVFATQWFVDWTNGHGTGLIVTGCAGTGKTHFTRHLECLATARELVVLKIAFTHAACCQMGAGSQTISSFFGLDERVGMRQCLQRPASWSNVIHREIDVLIVDEISMVPMSHWEALYLYHRAHPQTRLVLVGDFYQLPPVEKHFQKGDYWETCDFLPSLVYDFVTDQHGYWLEMRECRRGQDVLMKEICENPLGIVQRIQECPDLAKLRVTLDGRIPIWRFVAWRNRTRKAVNHFCGICFVLQHPQSSREWLNPAELWAGKHKKPVSDYDKHKTGGHLSHLQPFMWCEGMEVVCRCTMYFYDKENRESTSRGCVNNRRGVLRLLDKPSGEYHIEWKDDPSEMCVLSRSDFGLHFVPGFCSTVHMSQGESISEHLGIMEWEDIQRDSRMAYVALTRSTHSDLVHLISMQHQDPWGGENHEKSLGGWVLRNLYQLARFQEQFLDYHETLLGWEARVREGVSQSQPLMCQRCQKRLDIPHAMACFDAQLTLLCKPCVHSKKRPNNEQ